jgi:hypothetical protein
VLLLKFDKFHIVHTGHPYLRAVDASLGTAGLQQL